VLCVDKTGTLTENALTVTSVHALPGIDEAHVLGMAALAQFGWRPGSGGWRHPRRCRTKTCFRFTKAGEVSTLRSRDEMSEATLTDSRDATIRAVKGAFAAVSSLAQPSPDASKIASDLEAKGFAFWRSPSVRPRH